MTEKFRGSASALHDIRSTISRRIGEVNQRLFGTPLTKIERLDLRGRFHVESLNTFLGVNPKDVTSLYPLNSSIQGLGDRMRIIIESCGSLNEEQKWYVEQPVRDGRIKAFADRDLIFIEHYSESEEARKSNYVIYIPTIGKLENLATSSSFGSYFALDSRGDTYNPYYPEKNPRDPIQTSGYINVLQQATRDLLEATGLATA